MRRLRIAPALLLLVLAGTSPARASRASELFESGNDAYEKGRYEEAARAYETILSYGLRDPRVHYNLGNTYFKTGRLGPAILHYERALRLDPADREVRDNLVLARGLIRDRLEEPEIPYPLKALSGALDGLSTGMVTGVFLAFYLAAGGLAGAVLAARGDTRRRLLAYAALAAGLGAVIAGGGLGYKIRAGTRNEAIVMQDRVDVRSGPAEDNTVLFTVHEGTRMEVRNRLEGWYQVSLPNALSGWVPAGTVEKV
jgi:tetratricopeptide (TPR) repeat protein